MIYFSVEIVKKCIFIVLLLERIHSGFDCLSLNQLQDKCHTLMWTEL